MQRVAGTSRQSVIGKAVRQNWGAEARSHAHPGCVEVDARCWLVLKGAKQARKDQRWPAAENQERSRESRDRASI